MYRLIIVTACLASVMATAAETGPLQAAQAQLDSDGLRSLQFTAIGSRFSFTQPTRTADPLLPVRTIKSFEAGYDYSSGALRIEQVQNGGATAGLFTTESRTVEFISGSFAWNEGGGEGAAAAGRAQPQPASLLERQLWLWASTPQAVLKAAAGATARSVEGGTEFEFMLGGRWRATAFVNQMNQLERVDTRVPDDVLGDMPVTFKFTGYRDWGGVQFPSVIEQLEGGQPVLYLAVTGVRPNPGLHIDVPGNVRAFVVAPPIVKTEKLGDGIYWLYGGSHHSLAVDMGDHIVMIEAPLNEARSEAVIAEMKQLIPGKPIRFVVNTHVHSDHSGGLRTYVAEGATVVTHEANRAYYERIWAARWTLNPDRLSRSPRRVKFMTVHDRAELKGRNGRTIELHLLQGNPHNEQNFAVWLPAERILFQSDMLNAPAPAAGAQPTPTTLNFYQNLQRLKIEPQQIVGGHGARVLAMADLNTAVGRP